MNKQKKQFYCKLGQAVSNIAGLLFISSAFAFYIVYALVH